MVRATMRGLVAGMLALGCWSGVLAAGPKQQDAPAVRVKPATPVQKQVEAMRTAIVRNWNAPVGYQGKILVRIRLKRDGSLEGPPEIVSPPSDEPNYKMAAASVVRAVTLSQPFTMLGQESYDSWKDVEIEFVPLVDSR
jgi:hypothetical protein